MGVCERERYVRCVGRVDSETVMGREKEKEPTRNRIEVEIETE